MAPPDLCYRGYEINRILRNHRSILMNYTKNLYVHLAGTFRVMGIIVRNGIDDPSSNPGQGCLHFTVFKFLEKGINPSVLCPAESK